VRFRAACLALAAVLATTLLAGCGGSNVGIAAKVNGSQISETQLANYITPNAKGINLSGKPNDIAPPKSFVLYILIREQLYSALLRKTGGMPSQGRISSLVNSYVGNGTPQHAVEALGVHGYTAAFAQQVLRYRALGGVLDQRVRSGVQVGAAVRTLHFPVVINPRFGAWDAKKLAIVTSPNAGLPGYLRLQPSFAAVSRSG
jgi:outer membrane murein-binding lipoprotein Lpp